MVLVHRIVLRLRADVRVTSSMFRVSRLLWFLLDLTLLWTVLRVTM